MQKLKSVLIVGSKGQIGSILMQQISKNDFYIQGTSRVIGKNEIFLDLEEGCKKDQLPKVDYVIFAAGITSNEKCLESPINAWHINVERTCEYSNFFLENGSRLLFLSSNNVFSGETSFNKITDETNPKNFYGELKLEVEKYLLSHSKKEQVSVLRLTKVISEKTNILNRWFTELREKRELTIYTDVMIAPIESNLMTSACEEIMKRKLCGIFHLSGNSEITMKEFAVSEILKNGFSAENLRFNEIQNPNRKSDKIDHNSLENNLLM